MKIPIGKYVKVVESTDETFDPSFIGMKGLVIDHNDNGETGNTEDDPLHVVSFDLNTVNPSHPDYDPEAVRVESFWSEELELTDYNYIKHS